MILLSELGLEYKYLSRWKEVELKMNELMLKKQFDNSTHQTSGTGSYVYTFLKFNSKKYTVLTPNPTPYDAMARQ